MIYLDITPCPAPRQTRSDAWKKRPCVLRYRKYRDQVAAQLPEGFVFEDGMHIIFHLPMPKSWSKKKKNSMLLAPHKQKPDLDNLCKALFDAIYRNVDDSQISAFKAEKYWSIKGSIIIQTKEEQL